MNLKLPYRWHPLGTVHRHHEPPEVGSVLALAHAAWRVIEITHIPTEEWSDKERQKVEHFGPAARPYRVVIRPAAVTLDDPRSKDHDVHLRACGASWDVYPDEHYPVCASCSEPMPCREQMAARVAEASAKQMGRYETQGVCPECLEPITSRQKVITFTENLEIPGGPPVTYHAGRHLCRHSAAVYEKRWVAADPGLRKLSLSCPGHMTNHNDGTYECTQLNDCPGPQAFHPSYARCNCPDCHARSEFSCYPAPNAQPLRRDVS